MVALPIVVLPLRFTVSATVRLPLTVVVMPVLEMLTALALAVPTLRVDAPPVSRVKALAPPLVIPSAPLAVRAVEVPKDTVPLPACKVKLPAVVLQVAVLAEVRVSAPAVVVKLEAALPVRVTAPPVTLAPAEPVTKLLNVFAPPIV